MHFTSVTKGALSSFFPQHSRTQYAARAGGWDGSLHAALWSSAPWRSSTGGSLGLKIAETGSAYCKPKGKSLGKSELPDRITGWLKEHARKHRDKGSRDYMTAWLNTYCFQTLHHAASNPNSRNKTWYQSILGHQPSYLLAIRSPGHSNSSIRQHPPIGKGFHPNRNKGAINKRQGRVS